MNQRPNFSDVHKCPECDMVYTCLHVLDCPDAYLRLCDACYMRMEQEENEFAGRPDDWEEDESGWWPDGWKSISKE